MRSCGRRSGLSGTNDAKTRAVRTRGAEHGEGRGRAGLGHEERRVRAQRGVSEESVQEVDLIERIVEVEVEVR